MRFIIGLAILGAVLGAQALITPEKDVVTVQPAFDVRYMR